MVLFSLVQQVTLFWRNNTKVKIIDVVLVVRLDERDWKEFFLVNGIRQFSENEGA